MEAKAKKLLKLFGISEIADKYPAEISGGQKQRTAVARALMNDPLLILADEPTGNLDSRSSEAVIGAFLEARKKLNATTFMVTHDSFSANYCDRDIVMKGEKIFTELIRKGGRREFLDELLTVLKDLSREIGILLALGAEKHTLKRSLAGELAQMTAVCSAAGILLGAVIAFIAGNIIEVLVADVYDGNFTFTLSGLLLSVCYALILFLFIQFQAGR